MSESDARRLRIADSESADAASRAAPAPVSGAQSFLGKTATITTYPTVAARYYAVTVYSAMGTETEGAAGTFTSRTRTVFALNLGGAIPPSGTYILVTWVNHRWVFRYDG